MCMNALNQTRDAHQKTHFKHSAAKNILCLDGNYLSSIQWINSGRLFSKINLNYCFSLRLILCIWYFLTKHCVLCFADLSQETLSAVCNDYESIARKPMHTCFYIYVLYMCWIFTAWWLLLQPFLSRFFPSFRTFCQEQVLACTLRINWGLLFSKISPAQPCWISPPRLMAEAASTAGRQGPVKFSRSCHASIFSHNTHESSQILFPKKSQTRASTAKRSSTGKCKNRTSLYTVRMSPSKSAISAPYA